MKAWWDGLWRECYAPAILTGVWLITLLVSVPMTLAMRGMLAQHLGRSLAGDTAADGVNYDWMQEFSDQASGLGVTFRPAVIGFGAVLDNASAFIEDTERPIVIVGAASVYILLWIFVAGGIIDRYARNRPTRARGFFSACGVFFFRFLRLAVIQWIVYALLFGYVHRWLLDTWYTRLIHDVSVERTAFFIRLGLYALFGLLIAAATTIFDYAKVRAVVEDRRSMIGAIGAALGFIRRNLGGVIVVFALNLALFTGVIALYALIAPGAGGTGASMWIGAIIGQVYVLARLWVKLVFWASETALFQSRLAHAGYVARPVPAWPESPAAEAL
jgi:hypothetical protein